MRILVGESWKDGYLDEHLGEGQVRVAVRALAPVLRLTELYFEPRWSVRRLWNYAWELGPTRLFYKVVSRLRERGRNQKYVCVGVGDVLEWKGDGEPWLEPGSTVLFVAPCHPRCVERVVLEPELVHPCPEELAGRLREVGAIRFFDRCAPGSTLAPFAAIAGHLPYSGEKPHPGLLEDLFAAAEEILQGLDPATARSLSRGDAPPSERSRAPAGVAEGILRAVLYGYGHYAKTNILPNLPRTIRCVTVHEVDPTQLGPADRLPFACDSSPGLGDREHYDVHYVAGYHHTHAPLACAALRSGAYAVVEKPLVTSRDQLEELLATCRNHPGRFFAGFHKRYSRFNEYAWKDLGVDRGHPISYYCIVFEVPLPARHWYRWPSSRGRITSNGCHWIDHFLYLNGFPAVRDCSARAFADGDVVCSAQAENGANFTMVLTDKGSNRIGLEEYVELRTRDRTITVNNNGIYRAESASRVLRRARQNKNLGYTKMYRAIGRKIASREAGDSLESIGRSSTMMLDLEDAVPRRRSR